MQVEGTDKRIGGIYYYIPNEQNVKDISNKLNQHLGVTPKSVRMNNKKRLAFANLFYRSRFVTFL